MACLNCQRHKTCQPDLYNPLMLNIKKESSNCKPFKVFWSDWIRKSNPGLPTVKRSNNHYTNQPAQKQPGIEPSGKIKYLSIQNRIISYLRAFLNVFLTIEILFYFDLQQFYKKAWTSM